MNEHTKKCTYCSVILSDDNKTKGRNQCKKCVSERYKEYVKSKLANQYSTFDGTKKCSSCDIVLSQENCVKNRPICKKCYNAKCKEYKKANKEKVSNNHKEYYEANKEKIAEYYKTHYKENKDTYMENNKKWREANRETRREKENQRFRNDPIARLVKNARTRICKALKGNGKQTIQLIDCNIDFLKTWLQHNFTDEMTFDNYGSYWHVDHVIPCAKFNLEDDDEVAHCFRWTNLQPLKASINISKQSCINNDEIKNHYKKVKSFAKENNIDIPKFYYRKYLN